MSATSRLSKGTDAVSTSGIQGTLENLLANVQGMAYQCRNTERRSMCFASAGAIELCGYEPHELTSDAPSWRDIVYPPDRHRVWAIVQEAISQQKSFETDYRIVDRSGGIKWVWERGRAIRLNDTDTLLEGLIVTRAIRNCEEDTLISARTSKHRAIRERDDSESRYRALFETAGCVMLRLTPDGSLLEWNPAAEQLFGFRLADVAGRDYIELFVVADDQESVRANLALVGREDAIMADVESRVIDSAGGARSLRWSMMREFESHHGVSGVIAVGYDITAENDFEAALIRSEAYFRAIIDTAADAIITIDAEGQIETFNAAAEQLFGYSAGEALGCNVSMLMTETDRVHHDQYLRRHTKTGKTSIIGRGRELIGLRKNGTSLPIHLTISEVKAPRQNAYAAIIRDLTEQKNSEAMLHREHQRLTTIIEQAPMGIVIRRIDGAVVQVNQAFCQLTGYTAQELQSCLLTKIIHPGDHPEDAATLAEAQSGAISRDSERQRYIKKDGTILDVRVISAVTHDLQGAPEFVIGEVEDLTPRLNAEAEAREHRERLAHAERLNTLGEMASGIAHEINQPLTAISLFSQAGKRLFDKGEYDRARVVFDKLSQHALRAGAVIERVQNMVHRGDSVRENGDCGRLTTDVAQLAEADARIHDITIEIETEADLPTVVVDAVQIQQVTLNLLRNGMQAMGSIQCRNGNSITLKTKRCENDMIQVSVIDSGCGVSEQTAEKLFTPFETTKESGMGVGLSISRAIITAHGGELKFFNNDTHGSTFYFTVPVNAVRDSDE